MSPGVILKAKAWKYGDNIDTDAIIPARYLTSSWSPSFCNPLLSSPYVARLRYTSSPAS